jgi:hypothetical protein
VKKEKEKVEKTDIEEYRVKRDTFEKRWFPNIKGSYTTFEEDTKHQYEPGHT